MYTLHGIQLWGILTVDRPLWIVIDDFTGDQCHESHLGLQIRKIQGPCYETGESLRSPRFRESEPSLLLS